MLVHYTKIGSTIMIGLVGMLCPLLVYGFEGDVSADETGASGLEDRTVSSFQQPYRMDLHIAQSITLLTDQQKQTYFHLASQLRCPTCTGLSVLQSDAPLSLEIKRALLLELQERKSEAEILDFFKQRYGLWILREPPRSGFHVLAWLVPILLLLAMLLWWVIQWLRFRRINVVNLPDIASEECVALRDFEEQLALLRKQTES